MLESDAEMWIPGYRMRLNCRAFESKDHLHAACQISGGIAILRNRHTVSKEGVLSP